MASKSSATSAKPIQPKNKTATAAKKSAAGKGETSSKKTTSKQDPKGKSRKQHTCVTVHYDAGFSNELFVRGEGAGLSWEKGKKLKNIDSDEWAWETRSEFDHCEFKILLNDEQYEVGDNHRLSCGKEIHFSPRFS